MKTFITTMLMTAVCICMHSQELLWSIETDTLQILTAKDISTDDAGNVYIGSHSQEGAYILKYDKNGSFGFASGDGDHASYESMAMAANGNTWLAGSKSNGVSKDALLMGFDTDGSTLFTQQYDLAGKDDEFTCVLPAGQHIFVCGRAYNTDFELCGLVACYAADGSPVWIQHHNEAQKHLLLGSLCMSSQGNLHATGYKTGTSPGPSELFRLVYSPDGSLLSEYSLPVGGYYESIPTFSLMDDNDNQFIGGYVREGGSETAFLLKLSGNTLSWLQMCPQGAGSNYFDGCFSQEGNIVCTGKTNDLSDDAYCICYSPGGSLLGEITYDSPYGLNESAIDVRAKGEYVYLCGASEGLGTSLDMFALKLNSAMEMMWEIRYNSYSNNTEYASGIDVDTEGNVLLGGCTVSTGGYALNVWKYSNPLGIDDYQALPEQHPYLAPNPASDMISLYDFPIGKDARYRIISSHGSEILSGNINGNRVDVSLLKPGTYIFQLIQGVKTVSAGFVKN